MEYAAPLAMAGETGDGKRSQRIPRALLGECLWRTRRPGDRMIPFGMPGTRKLSDVLVDRKVDRPFRDQIPLLTRDGEVLWAVGVVASEALRTQNEEEALLLTWNGDLPWLNGK